MTGLMRKETIMKDKQLKDVAIKIKGNDYVLVSDRVTYFNENYPNGSILTEYEIMGDTYICKATVTPDVKNPDRKFNGLSQATIGDGMVNKSAALENAETSAWGRALGAMGIGVIESIASADEMNKAVGSNGSPSMTKYATEKQVKWIRDTIAREFNLENIDDIDKVGESILTIPITEVPLKKVKSAVDLIEKTSKEDKKTDSPKITDDMKKQLEEGISLDDIPY